MTTTMLLRRLEGRGVRWRTLLQGLLAWLAWHGAASAAAAAGSGIEAPRVCRPDAAVESYAPAVFLGYACRDVGCTAHKAGFAWAERHGLAQAQACTGLADPGSVEGCRAYAEEAVTAEQAGFEWARENEVDDACRCAGAGPRFEAGCAAYVAGFAH
jgi:hypothetical protein